MLKLRLENVKKTYRSGEVVTALRGVSMDFRDSEFVSILGPSGCGKTTLLNIIGGLDRYDSGELAIGGVSTQKFRDADWDAYRNRSIGFVFQSYNLIGHQTVLHNVEIALTLSGVSAAERKRRATQALEEVGLADQIKKKPNQLSGGQMQRVAVARALVNNPDIILADEPTGALDSQTSVQLMEIMKKIAQTRLVIMVTHNGELAERYSSRIIRLLDGEVQSDSNPPEHEDAVSAEPEAKKFKKTSMSLWSAAGLSFKNLLTKRGRTAITSFAGSIGIIGVALVLALSGGLTSYMDQMQSETLSGFPLTISQTAMEMRSGPPEGMFGNADTEGKFTDQDVLYSYDSEANTRAHENRLTPEYFDYVANIQTAVPGAVNTVAYSRGVEVNLLAKGGDSVVKYATKARNGLGAMLGGGGLYWQELPDNEPFILSLYDLIGEGSRLPAAANEVAIVVDEYNKIDKAFFEKLGISSQAESYRLTDFIGKTMLKVVPNDSFYTRTENGLFIPATAADYGGLFGGEEGISLTVTGILRIKENSSSSYLSPGLVYTTALTDHVVQDAQASEIARTQSDSDVDVIANAPFANDDAKKQRMLELGADTTPTAINIYPKDFAGKDAVKEYLDKYNAGKAEDDQVIYTDLAETIGTAISTMLNTVSYVLIGFAAISLLVSTIMIGIITYVSVIERTKEIGILRSVGARKKDISRVFNAEAMIIGFAAGTLGVAISYLMSIPINMVITNLTGIKNIAALSPLHAAILIAGSIALTLIAAFFPSKMAAKKDPVVALRME